jgi:hypothetical protein
MGDARRGGNPAQLSRLPHRRIPPLPLSLHREFKESDSSLAASPTTDSTLKKPI